MASSWRKKTTTLDILNHPRRELTSRLGPTWVDLGSCRSCNHTFWTDASVGGTYEAGDNLLKKVEPFKDNLNDGDYTGCSTSGTWDASNRYMTQTHCV